MEPSSAKSRTRIRRKSVRLIDSLRIIRTSCPFITKKEGAFPRVIASLAGPLMSLRAMKTPRVKVDLPSILPRHTGLQDELNVVVRVGTENAVPGVSSGRFRQQSDPFPVAQRLCM
jgi:hypothetical protein